ncbi:MAG: hypothetical protein C4563_08225 [Desulfobulbus sp.]|jgi:hypothetical protein|nr:MAG: hypothetical protein C4563_08225 [Desulfobulbus sp.]
MLNRAALILRYNEPFVRWINTSDPNGKNPNISLEEANQDKIVYLIDEDEAENPEEWIALNHENLFAMELDGWYTDESLWPQNRSLEMFYQWFTVECHSAVIDTCAGPIFDDEE